MKISPQRVVTLHYVLTNAQGEVLDDSRKRQEPMEYLHGHDNLMAALEQELEGNQAGATLSATLPAEDAYGARDEALVRKVSRSAFPVPELKPGMSFQTRGEAGPQIVTVLEVNDSSVLIDTNHPLAGQALSYDLEVLDVREATRAELAKGHPLPPGTEHSQVEDKKVL
ncbi:FKBP-type peptidyl-prolyl cis-trans isomerase [Halomonas binhaiensis]|uniref:Peptidyl-prolyl cis-trans isomerase n=1 Tax=Halomonas binhaiensis TaxID=2562282 RepID=A0A5C1NGS4_9GAMM|nr:peptidylprolyl isomerase [Halomonas binhaiensis]QEM81425.1 peptidylprolyl isomerase [Halomonas binhaiensis]